MKISIKGPALRAGFFSCAFPGGEAGPARARVLVAKGSFTLDPQGHFRPLERPLPLCGDTYEGPARKGRLLYPSDFVPPKPRVDLLLSAKGPLLEAGFRIGPAGKWIAKGRAERLGPVPAEQRLGRRGTFDGTWLASRWPAWPNDRDPELVQAAPPDQRLDALQGGEEIDLTRLWPSVEHFRARLPDLRVLAAVQAKGAQPVRVPMRLDTLWLSPETSTLVLVWRGLDSLTDEPEQLTLWQQAPGEAPPADLAELPASAEEATKAEGATEGEDELPDEPPGLAREPVLAALGRGESLVGRDLCRADLSDLDLGGVDLSDTLLTGACFDRSLLRGARLDRATAGRASFVQADLRSASLRQADLTGADLSRADLTGGCLEQALLETANLEESDLSEAQLRGASLRRARLTRATGSRADLSGADLTEARLEQMDLQGATLARAILERASATGARWTSADLTGARAAGARLAGATLRGVMAPGSIWTSAELTGADLSHADLARAELGSAQLAGARLDGANLPHASLEGAHLAQASVRQANLFRARLERADLRGADFDGANCFEAELWQACTAETSFRGANLGRTKRGQPCR